MTNKEYIAIVRHIEMLKDDADDVRDMHECNSTDYHYASGRYRLACQLLDWLHENCKRPSKGKVKK